MAVDSATVQVVMPAMGDSVSEGTVLEWHKGVGDHVNADETIVEISTDKVDAEVPAPVAGTVVKVLVGEGETVSVGAPLAEISTDGVANGGGSAPAVPVTAESPPATAEEATAGAATEAEGAAAVEAASGELVDITTPSGGESVTEGTILEWAVAVGDEVADGQTIVELSTDKVDMELPAPAAGVITEILAEVGETVHVGQVIARMLTDVPAPAGRRSRVRAARRRGRELDGRSAGRGACHPAARRRGRPRALHGRVARDPDGDVPAHDDRHRHGRAPLRAQGRGPQALVHPPHRL